MASVSSREGVGYFSTPDSTVVFVVPYASAGHCTLLPVEIYCYIRGLTYVLFSVMHSADPFMWNLATIVFIYYTAVVSTQSSLRRPTQSAQAVGVHIYSSNVQSIL